MAGTSGLRTTCILPAAAEMSRSITRAWGAPVGLMYIAPVGSDGSLITCNTDASAQLIRLMMHDAMARSVAVLHWQYPWRYRTPRSLHHTETLPIQPEWLHRLKTR